MAQVKDLPRQLDLARRAFHPERMDQPDIERRDHELALRGLASVNWVSRSYQHFWTAIAKLAKLQPTKPLRVLDVACGGGDIAVKLARAARRASIEVTVDGCDISRTAIDFAEQRARKAGVSCRFFHLDVLNDVLPQHYDVICSSLFLHHLPTKDAGLVLQQFASSARQQVLINDLVRSRLGYVLARVGSHLLSRSPVVHYDGPISVANAFTPAELRQMADAAGMSSARISRVWPERMVLVWNKP